MALVNLREFGKRQKPPISVRRVNQLCLEGRIPGAYQEGFFIWRIPEDAAILPPPIRKGRKMRGHR